MNMTIDELKNYPMPRVIPLPKWSKAAENSVICLDGSWKVTDKKDGAVQQVQVPLTWEFFTKRDYHSTTDMRGRYSFQREKKIVVLC